MRRGAVLFVVLFASMPAAAQAARRPVLKATCTAPVRPLTDAGGTGLLRVVRLSGSLRIGSVRLAGGQPAQSSGFALSRSRMATNAFRFRAKRLAGPSRMVRYGIRIVVRSVRFGRSVRTRIVICVVRVVHAQATPPVPAPPGPAPPSPAPPSPPPPVDQYVALGDSFAAGQGTGVYTDEACKRSASAHPALIDVQRPNTELTFVACAAADTDDVRNDQLGALGAGTDIVTITVGANDVGYPDVLATCASQADANCSAAIASANDAITNTLAGLLDALYAEIRAAAPTATVVVVGYPRPFGPGTCTGTALVSASEQGDINDAADAAGDVIKARAQAAGFSYVDPIPTFTSHGSAGRAVPQRRERRCDRGLPPQPRRPCRLRGARQERHRMKGPPMLRRILAAVERHPAAALIVSIASLAVSLTGAAIATIPAKDGDVHACYSKGSGEIKVINTQADRFACERNWAGFRFDTTPTELVSPNGDYGVQVTNRGVSMTAPSGEVRLSANKISIAAVQRSGQGIEVNSEALEGVKLIATGATTTMNATGIRTEAPDVDIRASGTIDLRGATVRANGSAVKTN